MERFTCPRLGADSENPTLLLTEIVEGGCTADNGNRWPYNGRKHVLQVRAPISLVTGRWYAYCGHSPAPVPVSSGKVAHITGALVTSQSR
jgi:hypothetical protein